MIKKTKGFIIEQLMLFPLLIVNWSLWAVSGYHKINQIISGKAWVAPDGWIPWLHTHFKGLFLDKFTEPLFFTLTGLEAFAGFLLTVAILKLEFFEKSNKKFFKAGLFFGALAIACMSFGQNLANADEDVFELSSYLTTTLLSYIFIVLYSKNKLS
jgi:hypothetical protein